MAEPAGLLIEAAVTEAELAFFRRSVLEEGRKVPVGHVLSRWLDRGDETGDVLIVHHDPEQRKLFLAWLLNHYDPDVVAPAWPVLEALGRCMSVDAIA